MTPAECTNRNLAVGTRVRNRRTALAATMPEDEDVLEVIEKAISKEKGDSENN